MEKQNRRKALMGHASGEKRLDPNTYAQMAQIQQQKTQEFQAGSKGEDFNAALREAIVAGMAEAEAARVAAADGGGNLEDIQEYQPGEEGPTATASATVQGTHDVSGKIILGGDLNFKADAQLNAAVKKIFSELINSGLTLQDIKNANKPQADEPEA